MSESRRRQAGIKDRSYLDVNIADQVITKITTNEDFFDFAILGHFKEHVYKARVRTTTG